MRIRKSNLFGTIKVPPSKSQSLRAILFASLAEGGSLIKNVLDSPDIRAMIHACELLGASVQKRGDYLEITGFGRNPKVPSDIIDAGNSGIVLRFISAILALVDGYSVITGDHSIRFNRPMQPLLDALNQLGAFAESTKRDGFAPIIIKGKMINGKVLMDGKDSQPVSSILIASSFLKGMTEIEVKNSGEKPWVQMTLDWFDLLGISYLNDNFEHYIVHGNAKISSFEYTVPCDYSSIAFPIASALITKSEVVLENVSEDSSQGDRKLIDQLVLMGAEIEFEKGGRLKVKVSDQLKGGVIDVNDFIDAVPVLAALGCYASSKLHLTNAAIARNKESDRLSSMKRELEKMGAKIEEREDALIIHPSKLKGAHLNSHNDHRIAMALSVAAMGASGETMIEGTECIQKTYPHFKLEMQKLGADIQ